MIRLTLNPKTEPQIHLFNKSVILIGADSLHADITLPELNLQPIHLKISEQNGFLIIINVAHDPFVSLNGHPFGKKLLKTGDTILVHHVEILFEQLDEPSLPLEDEGIDSLYQVVEDRIRPSNNKISDGGLQPVRLTQPTLLNINLPFEKEVEALKDEDLKTTDLDYYLKEIEQSSSPFIYPVETEKEATNRKAERKQPISLKDDYLRELDDDHQNLPLGLQPTEQNHLYHAWKWIIFFIFSVLTITGIIGTVIYLTVSDNTEAQEVKVAQGMSDIAMALMHAQLYNIKPPNQNWSDIDFIKTNLQTILPQAYSYASEIDAQGQFTCCAYSLRTYTSSDLSHFLLIAQPAPSLLHWLIPKSVILIHSQDMELRSIKDLRSLNRLLATPDPLEGVSGKEILALVKQGELIQLASLVHDDRNTGFAPPDTLHTFKPGAENLIYNAPRYYRIGQSLIEKALALSTSKGTSQEVALLRHEVESFSRLNHLVLYAEQGKKTATLVKQSIMTFAPSDKILFGYLSQNIQGKTAHVNLLTDEQDLKDSSFVAALSNEGLSDTIALQSVPSKPEKEGLALQQNSESNKQVDVNHPIYIQLHTLATARENDLAPLVQALTSLLNEEVAVPTYHFQEDFQALSHQYLMTDIKHKQKIKEVLSHLYYQYDELPINQFIEFIKAVGFDQLIQHDEQSFTLADENCMQNIETILTHIENAKNLVELDHFIYIATSWLTFDYMQNSEDLLQYQNLLRNKVLAQLEKLLFSYQKHMELSSLKEEERKALQNILNRERIVHLDEKEFFLEEFDRLFKQEQFDYNSINTQV